MVRRIVSKVSMVVSVGGLSSCIKPKYHFSIFLLAQVLLSDSVISYSDVNEDSWLQ